MYVCAVPYRACGCSRLLTTMTSVLNQQKMVTEGLRIESQAQRVPMSKSVKELVDYIVQRMPQDPLIVGIDKKSNHFIEQGKCSVI